jgi:hypothetical protein
VESERRHVEPDRGGPVVEALGHVGSDAGKTRRKRGLEDRRFLNLESLERAVRHRQRDDKGRALARGSRELHRRGPECIGKQFEVRGIDRVLLGHDDPVVAFRAERELVDPRPRVHDRVPGRRFRMRRGRRHDGRARSCDTDERDGDEGQSESAFHVRELSLRRLSRL